MNHSVKIDIPITKYASGQFNTPLLPGQMFNSKNDLLLNCLKKKAGFFDFLKGKPKAQPQQSAQPGYAPQQAQPQQAQAPDMDQFYELQKQLESITAMGNQARAWATNDPKIIQQYRYDYSNGKEAGMGMQKFSPPEPVREQSTWDGGDVRGGGISNDNIAAYSAGYAEGISENTNKIWSNPVYQQGLKHSEQQQQQRQQTDKQYEEQEQQQYWEQQNPGKSYETDRF